MTRFQWKKYTVFAGIAASVLSLSVFGGMGCGGGSANTVPGPLKETGTFYGADTVPFRGTNGTDVILGRSFVTLNNGDPVSVGFELSRAGREEQPPTAITDEGPNVYFVALPPEAAATCFKQVAVFYFTGHPIDQYRPQSEPPHFHTVFLINAPQQPGADFTNETVYPTANEVPPGVERGVPDTVVPGVGVSYDDPINPAGQPARITIGQNFLYYNGHMNGMVVGTNRDVAFDSPPGHYLRDPNQLETRVIPQPAIYPRPGWYPGRWTIRYDTAKKVNIFEMTDFVYAGPEVSRKK